MLAERGVNDEVRHNRDVGGGTHPVSWWELEELTMAAPRNVINGRGTQLSTQTRHALGGKDGTFLAEHNLPSPNAARTALGGRLGSVFCSRYKVTSISTAPAHLDLRLGRGVSRVSLTHTHKGVPFYTKSSGTTKNVNDIYSPRYLISMYAWPRKRTKSSSTARSPSAQPHGCRDGRHSYSVSLPAPSRAPPRAP